MIGAILIILILAIVIPIGFLLSMAVLAAFLGSTLRKSAALKYKDSELLDLA